MTHNQCRELVNRHIRPDKHFPSNSNAQVVTDTSHRNRRFGRDLYAILGAEA
jgi:hypothetical protein